MILWPDGRLSSILLELIHVPVSTGRGGQQSQMAFLVGLPLGWAPELFAMWPLLLLGVVLASLHVRLYSLHQEE